MFTTAIPFLSGWTHVSTPTILIDWSHPCWAPLVRRQKTLLFCVVNNSDTLTVTMLMETSELLPGYPDTDKQLTYDIPPKQQGSFEVGPGATRTYFRLSAHTPAPDFVVADVKFSLMVFDD